MAYAAVFVLGIVNIANDSFDGEFNTSCIQSNVSSGSFDLNCTGNDSYGDVVPVFTEPESAFVPNERLEHFQEQSRFWVQRVLVPIIMGIGVIGNTVTIIIMTQRRMRSSTNCYLAALAIFDMSYLVFSFLLSLQHYPHIHDIKYHIYWKVWPYVITLTDASSNVSVWLTVTFTVERYIAVCHPIKGKIICTESRAQKIITMIFIISFLITLPTAFEWSIIEVSDASTNSTRIRVSYSELGLHPVYVSVYYWVISVLFIIVPFILLAVFNAFLIRSVHSSKSRRKTMTRRRETGDQSRQESKITIMLIAVVILFFVCQLPTAVILLYRSFHHVEDGGNEDLLLRGLGNIFNFLMAVNAAGNFVLYCLLSQKYRRTFLQIFCPCMKAKINVTHSAYQYTTYSTVENESPSVIRKYSVRPTRCSFSGDMKLLNTGDRTRSTYRKHSVRAPALLPVPPNTEYTNPGTGVANTTTTALCYSNKLNHAADADETHYRRVLRGFRCIWKRPKVSSGTCNTEDGNQLISLRPTPHGILKDSSTLKEYEYLEKSQL